jgi:hypothetical protein
LQLHCNILKRILPSKCQLKVKAMEKLTDKLTDKLTGKLTTKVMSRVQPSNMIAGSAHMAAKTKL